MSYLGQTTWKIRLNLLAFKKDNSAQKANGLYSYVTPARKFRNK